jgi:hypothetical protein
MLRFPPIAHRCLTPARWLAWMALCCALCACVSWQREMADLKEPRVSFAGLRLMDANLLAPAFRVRLRVENPNDREISIQGADLGLAINGEPVAQGVSVGAVKLVQLGSSEIEVDATAQTLALARQLLSINGSDTVKYGVNGHLRLLNWLGPLGAVPIDFQGEMARDELLKNLESLQGLGL